MLLEVNNLGKQFRGPAGVVKALDGVSLSLEAGQFLAVQGPSGCGKTTLLLAIGGLLEPDSGTVMIGGENPYELDTGSRAGFRAANVGFVFQQFHLIPYLSVLDNILVPALTTDDGSLCGRAMELIGQFKLEERAGHVPAKLSTGERQRVAIARAILRKPRILLADEPTGNLDAATAGIVLECLRETARQGTAVILVTHDDNAAKHADRAIRLGVGK